MAAFTAAQHDRGDRCGGRGSRISARFSGRMAPVVRARTPAISAVLVAIPLRDLELLFFSCLPVCLCQESSCPVRARSRPEVRG